MDKSIDKILDNILDNMDMQLINLEIQVIQIQDDASARGAMVAVEELRKELKILKEKLEG